MLYLKAILSYILIFLGLILAILGTLIHYLIYKPYIFLMRFPARISPNWVINLLSMIGVIPHSIFELFMGFSNKCYAISTAITTRINK